MIEDSIYLIVYRGGPISFDDIVLQVHERHPEVTRNQAACDLAGLIRKNRVALNQERTGFVANKRVESDTGRFPNWSAPVPAKQSRIQF